MDLCKHLLTIGIPSCGTLRLNRKGLPRAFKEDKLRKGEMISYVDSEVTGVKWMDKRPVAVISTIDDSSMVTVNRRSRHAQGGVEAICKPAMINEYNKYMGGGEDIADQLVTYYGFQHCSKKWWKRVFFHLLDVTMVNAFVIYKSSRHHNVKYLVFMVDVVKGLLQKSGTDMGIEGNFPGTITPFRLMVEITSLSPLGRSLTAASVVTDAQRGINQVTNVNPVKLLFVFIHVSEIITSTRTYS